MDFYLLVLGILSVWRITHFFSAEDGPWDISYRLRRRAGQGFWGKLLDCFNCLSIWIALPFAYFIGKCWEEKGLLWLSFSAGAILLNQLVNSHNSARQPEYSEDKEEK
jgi:hypothetical protein